LTKIKADLAGLLIPARTFGRPVDLTQAEYVLLPENVQRMPGNDQRNRDERNSPRVFSPPSAALRSQQQGRTRVNP
jgi:hypothetical protein